MDTNNKITAGAAALRIGLLSNDLLFAYRMMLNYLQEQTAFDASEWEAAFWQRIADALPCGPLPSDRELLGACGGSPHFIESVGEEYVPLSAALNAMAAVRDAALAAPAAAGAWVACSDQLPPCDVTGEHPGLKVSYPLIGLLTIEHSEPVYGYYNSLDNEWRTADLTELFCVTHWCSVPPLPPPPPAAAAPAETGGAGDTTL